MLKTVRSRLASSPQFFLLGSVLLAACAGGGANLTGDAAEASPDATPDAGAATGGSGGDAASTGGKSGTGGAATGGGTATGGKLGSGGNTASGGASAVGGKPGTGGGPASGGKSGNGGKAGGAATGGRPGTGGGVGGTKGTGGTGGSAIPSGLCTWPTSVGADQKVSVTISVATMLDGGMQRFVGDGPLGTATQSESQGPLFDLKDGAILRNVILGNPAADGVHCNGTCTLENVWWEDVGEDAATLKGTSASQVMTIHGGGAAKASDKVFQHNGPGTMVIDGFCAEDFGKLYRSCGNCSTQYTRHVEMRNILAIPRSNTLALAGVNANYHDTATFAGIVIKDKVDGIDICTRYTGNDTGAEPPKLGAGADGSVCIYTPADIVWAP